MLLANPNDAPAEVTLRFLPSSGVPVTTTKNLAGRSRMTVNIEGEDPSLSNAPVATQVTSTQPIVVERAQYWPDPAPQWYEAHNSFGVTQLGTRWGLAEGRVGGANNYQTAILLANPGTERADVTIQFLRASGAPVVKTFEVQPASRFNVSVGPGSLVPELVNEEFGAIITSTQPLPSNARSTRIRTARPGQPARTRQPRACRGAERAGDPQNRRRSRRPWRSRTTSGHSLRLSGSPPSGKLSNSTRGEMAEWFKAHAWKACVGETLPWVRIPLSPPL